MLKTTSLLCRWTHLRSLSTALARVLAGDHSQARVGVKARRYVDAETTGPRRRGVRAWPPELQEMHDCDEELPDLPTQQINISTKRDPSVRQRSCEFARTFSSALDYAGEHN